MCVRFEEVRDLEVFFADYLEKSIGGLGTDREVCEVIVEDGVDDCAVFCLGAYDDILPRACFGFKVCVDNWVHFEGKHRKRGREELKWFENTATENLLLSIFVRCGSLRIYRSLLDA